MKTDDTVLSEEQIKEKIGIAHNAKRFAEVDRLKLILKTKKDDAEVRGWAAGAAEKERKAVAEAARRQQQADDTAKCTTLGVQLDAIAARIDAHIQGFVDDMSQLRDTHDQMLQLAMSVKVPLSTDAFMEMFTIYIRRRINLSGFMGRVQAEEGPSMAQASTGWTASLLNELQAHLVAERIASPAVEAVG